MTSCKYCGTKPKFLVLIDGRLPVCFACLVKYYPEAAVMISDYLREFKGVEVAGY